MRGQVKAGCECEIAPWMKFQIVLVCDLLIQSLGTCGLFKQEKNLLCTTTIATQQPVEVLSAVLRFWKQIYRYAITGFWLWQYLLLTILTSDSLPICFIAINQIMLFAEGPRRMICVIRVKGLFVDLSWGSDVKVLNSRITRPVILEDIVEELCS